jgi:hypothetical protein
MKLLILVGMMGLLTLTACSVEESSAYDRGYWDGYSDASDQIWNSIAAEAEENGGTACYNERIGQTFEEYRKKNKV